MTNEPSWAGELVESVLIGLANGLPRMRYFDRKRARILRLAGVNIKGKCTVWGPVTIRPVGAANNIEIGEGSFINTEIRFGAPTSKIKIGERVQVAPRVMFETVDHGLHYVPGEGRGGRTRPITVGSKAWIGAGAIITPGVDTGAAAVVAAGAVVTKDVAPGTIVAGIPARPIEENAETEKNNV